MLKKGVETLQTKTIKSVVLSIARQLSAVAEEKPPVSSDGTPSKLNAERDPVASLRSKQEKKLIQGFIPYRRRVPISDLFSAKGWRMIESIYLRDGVKWGLEELRIAWKRCVLAYIDDNTRQLVGNSPCTTPGGRQFLSDLLETTINKLEKNKWKMTGKQARDIGWAAGKQWFMDERLVDAVQTGVLNGVDSGEIALYEAVPVAWAIANSGQYPERIFEEMKKQISLINESFNLQHCSNTIWSMAVCGYHPGEHFLQAVSSVACNLIDVQPALVIPQAIADLVTSCFLSRSCSGSQVWSLGRLNLMDGQDKVVMQTTKWAYDNLSEFSAEEVLTMAMGMAMLDGLGIEDMRTISKAFRKATNSSLLDVHIDQYVALTLLFPREHRLELHRIAFGTIAADQILAAHQDRQAQISVQMKNNKFLRLISRQLDKVAEGRYEIGTLTVDRNLALEILVHGDGEDYSVMPIYPMSRSRNNPDIELGEVRISQRLIEAQGIKFGGFLEWITPEDVSNVPSVNPSSEES